MKTALKPLMGATLGVALMSGVINLLYLTGSLFMLEVYDRVIPSRSAPTLFALAAIALALYAFQGALDLIRSRIFIRIGALIDTRLSNWTYEASIKLATSQRRVDPLQPGRDLDQVRQFLWGGGPTAFLDLPWLPIYVLICFLFHPLIGAAAVAGALILFGLALLTDIRSKKATASAMGYGAARHEIAEASRRNAEVIQAHGMAAHVGARWAEINGRHLATSGRASDIVASYGAISKVTRMVLQSFVLALGAWLVINQEATGGVMIASSILVARALAPVETVIGQWKAFLGARLAWRRLSQTLESVPVDDAPMRLAAPSKSLTVEGLTLAPPGGSAATVFDVSFSLNAGSALGVIGGSASGKSSLARALVGVWSPVRGAVRLDGAALDQWSAGRLGRHVGYVPQDVELFDGTVAENIARFQPDFDPDEVVEAARVAGVHEMILDLPKGYDSPIGYHGEALSAGQRQRVALARALYGDPFLVVLDEPNSNLDAEGEAALTRAITAVRARGGVVVVVAHRPSAIAGCDLLLMMNAGRCTAFGPKDQVLADVVRPAAQSNIRVATPMRAQA